MKHSAPLVCLLVTLGLVAGCGRGVDSITGPDGMPVAPIALVQGQASGWIGSGGGSLSAEGVTLEVPGRALAATTWVSLSVVETGGAFQVSIEPAGSVLRKAVVLTVPCEQGVGLRWRNPSTGAWEDLETNASAAGVQARVIQFSQIETEDNI